MRATSSLMVRGGTGSPNAGTASAERCSINVDYSTAAKRPASRTDALAVLHFGSTWLAKIVCLMPIAEALSTLTALSPLDGRYRAKVAALAEHFSEYALIRERIRVELAWLEALADEPGIVELSAFSATTRQKLSHTARDFGVADAERVKAIERT